MSTGTCTVHSWSDGADEDGSEDESARRVNHKLEADPAYYAPSAGRRSARAGLRSRVVARADSDDELADW